MSDVSVIVVTYNRLSLLKECIFNLLHQNSHLDNLFIINNNSNDGTKEYLNNIKNTNVVPINLRENLGGAGGFSYGLKYAYEYSHSNYFLIMDDDTMVLNDTLSSLLNKVKLLNGNFGFLSSDVRWWKDNKPSILNIPVVHKKWNTNIPDGLIKLQSASFVSLLVSRKAILKCGLPISEMFIWADDVEYTTRISYQMPSYFVPNSTVIHKCKNNSDDESIFNVQIKRLFYYKCMFRNRLYIYRKYYTLKYFFIKLLFYLFTIFAIPFKAKDYRIKRMIYIIKGVWNGLFFNPRIKFPRKK